MNYYNAIKLKLHESNLQNLTGDEIAAIIVDHDKGYDIEIKRVMGKTSQIRFYLLYNKKRVQRLYEYVFNVKVQYALKGTDVYTSIQKSGCGNYRNPKKGSDTYNALKELYELIDTVMSENLELFQSYTNHYIPQASITSIKTENDTATCSGLHPSA